MSGPDFHELVGDDLPPEERKRLRRAHDLLLEAGPPPELPPELAAPPRTGDRAPAFLPRRRRVALLVLAAALAVAAFGAGYLVGDAGGPSAGGAGERSTKVIRLRPVGSSDAAAVIRLGRWDASGNWPMDVTAAGLKHLPKGDYYVLYMTKHGKRVVTCGTFNVGGGTTPTSVRLNAAYDRSRFDGWSLTLYRHVGHKEHELLRA